VGTLLMRISNVLIVAGLFIGDKDEKGDFGNNFGSPYLWVFAF
jgi:hypothetical protein